jgi:hypothetical protein
MNGMIGNGDKRRTVHGIRLSYNQLSSLVGFNEAIAAVMDDPITNLHFIDLSHNQLTVIDDVSTAYP